MKMGLVVLVRNLLLTLCLCLVLGFMYYAAWKLHLLRWEDPNSGALTFDSVGRTLGSGLAVDSGQSRTQKEMIDARAARGPAQSSRELLSSHEVLAWPDNPGAPWCWTEGRPEVMRLAWLVSTPSACLHQARSFPLGGPQDLQPKTKQFSFTAHQPDGFGFLTRGLLGGGGLLQSLLCLAGMALAVGLGGSLQLGCPSGAWGWLLGLQECWCVAEVSGRGLQTPSLPLAFFAQAHP
ncbi:uncharacterized protein LOC114040509 isoform X2 [Vombatus ursinus]|uniref:uncharacterized protein LOC114040508 isoform X2 n=1 Tax=Vombatus ursinus TaxID=29139 RepID=UPI000FFCEDC5|nr:uncharacterized protein LOC114040508 isoform X2 [Vombatus ursinus]XP_027714441.1 uncharacterized protein LOC114040509 isoform X2 [Vombatus ursinus]